MTFDNLKRAPGLLAPIAGLYDQRVKECGATPKGVFWETHEGQIKRFEVLWRIVDVPLISNGLTVNDLGSGYGAFFEYIAKDPRMVGGKFYGYDISEEMVEIARKRITDPRASFMQSLVPHHKADYSFASGTFNLKGRHEDDAWRDYVFESLKVLWMQSRLGLAFNMLYRGFPTKASGLYGADPEEYLAFCRTTLSAKAELISHTYDDRDFTILVRR